MSGPLQTALSAVAWNKNISDLFAAPNLVITIESSNLRLAVWASQVEKIDGKSAAIGFIREMQHAGHNVACLISLGLYKPAAASMRAVVECALYYTYFRSHLAELGTLVRDSSFFIAKSDLIEFHKRHTQDFSARQAHLGYLGRLNNWYARTSAIVHGQIPGAWTYAGGVAGTRFDAAIASEAADHFAEATALVNDTLLCCVAQEFWRFFESDSKEYLLKGMPGATKEFLKLDAA